MKIKILVRVTCSNILFVMLNISAMDQSNLIAVEVAKRKTVNTINGYSTFYVSQPHVDEMKVLSNALKEQKGKNNKLYPLQAKMIDSDELMLLTAALDVKSNNDKFILLCDNLAKKEGLLETENLQVRHALDNENLRMLVNAAYKIGAEDLSGLLAGYYLSRGDILKCLPISDPVSRCLHKKSFEKRKIFLQKPAKFECTSVSFSPDNKKILAISRADNDVLMWNISDFNNPVLTVFKTCSEGDSNEPGVNRALFNSDATKIVLVRKSNPSSLIMMDISDTSNLIYTTVATLANNKSITGLALSLDNEKIVIIAAGSLVILYDVSNINNPVTIELLKNEYFMCNEVWLKCVGFSHDSKKIVIGGPQLIVCDISDISKPIHRVLSNSFTISKAIFSFDDSKIIAYGTQDKHKTTNCIIIDLNNIKNFVVNEKMFSDLAVFFSFDGRKILCRNINGFPKSIDYMALKIWDTDSMDCPFDLGPSKDKINVDTVSPLAISSDQKKVIAGNEENGKGLILATFLSDEEIKDLRSVNSLQGQFLYKLVCLNALGNDKIVPEQDSQYYRDFMSLPQKVRELLQHLS